MPHALNHAEHHGAAGPGGPRLRRCVRVGLVRCGGSHGERAAAGRHDIVLSKRLHPRLLRIPSRRGVFRWPTSQGYVHKHHRHADDHRERRFRLVNTSERRFHVADHRSGTKGAGRVPCVSFLYFHFMDGAYPMIVERGSGAWHVPGCSAIWVMGRERARAYGGSRHTLTQGRVARLASSTPASRSCPLVRSLVSSPSGEVATYYVDNACANY
mmetsp:Transcript_41420/g.95690  ORF Transcript_41420/g.95690 Transcript_41420/m.95690 type:complete len:213 (+) Transcript_41420:211-849(+)